jgi:hypothetical protein
MNTTVPVRRHGALTSSRRRLVVASARKPGKLGKPEKLGKPGKSGKSGKSGKWGKPSKSGEPGKLGKSGEPGKPGNSGKSGEPGEPGGPGKRKRAHRSEHPAGTGGGGKKKMTTTVTTKKRRKASSAAKADSRGGRRGHGTRWRHLPYPDATAAAAAAAAAVAAAMASAGAGAGTGHGADAVAAATLSPPSTAMITTATTATKASFSATLASYSATPQFLLPVTFEVGKGGGGGSSSESSSKSSFSFSSSLAAGAPDAAAAAVAAALAVASRADAASPGKLWQADIPEGWWCETFDFLSPRDAAKIMRDCKSFYAAGRWRFRKKALFVPKDVPSLRCAFDEIAHLCNLPKPVAMVSKIRLSRGVHELPEVSTLPKLDHHRRLVISEVSGITVSGERGVGVGGVGVGGVGVGGAGVGGVGDLQTTIVGQVSLKLKKPFSRFVFEDLCFSNGASALKIDCNSSVAIRRCLIQDCSRSGIFAAKGAQISVIDSTIQNCDEDGITCLGEETRVKLSNVQISGVYDAVWCCGGSEVEVRGRSMLHHNSSNALRTQGTKSRIVVATRECHAYENVYGNHRGDNIEHTTRLIERAPSGGSGNGSA